MYVDVLIPLLLLNSTCFYKCQWNIWWMGVARKRTRVRAAGRFREDVKLLITVVYSRETV